MRSMARAICGRVREQACATVASWRDQAGDFERGFLIEVAGRRVGLLGVELAE